MADKIHPSLCVPRNRSFFLSTNLTTKINTFNKLADRILWQLGAPTINVEISRDAIYNAINIAVEFYTKYSGYTTEYIVFHSSLYERGKGIRLDNLFSVRDRLLEIDTNDNNKLTEETPKLNRALTNSFNNYYNLPETVYTCIKEVPVDLYTNNSLSAIESYDNGISVGRIINSQLYGLMTDPISGGNPDLSSYFISSYMENIPLKGEEQSDIVLSSLNNAFDYDIMDYRKINAVIDFGMGESTGINTLFTIEQTLAQQTYFSYAMGNYGFDLISWYVLKNWLDTRSKVLSIEPTYKFNNRTQILTLYPEPTNSEYWAVLGCAVEMPLKDLLKVMWIQQYALALVKITTANIRGKWGSTPLFGNSVFNATDIMTQGIHEKETLEKELIEGTTPGFGEEGSEPVGFLIG